MHRGWKNSKMVNALHEMWKQFPHLSYAGQSICSVRGVLFPQELEHVQHAVEKRKREFLAGRILARQAWNRLGYPDSPLLTDQNRCPIWPKQVTGSISHTDHYCGAVIGDVSQYKSIGLDIEQIPRVKKVLWQTFCTPSELKILAQFPVNFQQTYATLVFSAKESYFKCHYQLHRVFFLFHDIEVQWLWDESKFNVSILNAILPPLSPNTHHHGFFHFNQQTVFTLVIQQ